MFQPGVVVHVCNPSTREAESGGSGVQCQPGFCSQTLPKKERKKKRGRKRKRNGGEGGRKKKKVAVLATEGNHSFALFRSNQFVL
jgi:hypothetical protein